MGILSILVWPGVIMPGGLSFKEAGKKAVTRLKSTEEIVSSTGLAPELLNASSILMLPSSTLCLRKKLAEIAGPGPKKIGTDVRSLRVY